MPLVLAAGQFSAAGRKPANDDALALALPEEPLRSAKGAVAVVADGISTSADARAASQAAVRGFLADYYSTSEAWSVKQSASRVLAATNSWLHAQTQAGAGRWDKDRGWVCTLSALVLRSRTAHLFHVGDTRIWQVHGGTLEPLTRDHTVAGAGGTSYLGRALGVAPQVEIDYRALPLAPGDTFLLTSDGVHGWLRPEAMAALVAQHADDLEAAARAIAGAALDAGSTDNLTALVLRVDDVPAPEREELAHALGGLPPAPLLAARMAFDGWRIVRELHASPRSHVYLAVDLASGEQAALKVPSTEAREDPRALERLLQEEWIAGRLEHPNVLKAVAPGRRRSHLYAALEYVEGRTLAQWMRDHPRPPLESVRSLVEQVARGLRAMHRLEMVHQDLRPENVVVDATGTARIIDFGAVHVAGLAEDAPRADASTGEVPPGALACTAPERFVGLPVSPQADQYALAVLAYRTLAGQLPYGADAARCRSVADLRRLQYRSLQSLRPDVPDWVDGALARALHPEPHRRYGDVAEFVHALRVPDPAVHRVRRVPLAERHPLVFWKTLTALLALACVGLMGMRVLGA